MTQAPAQTETTMGGWQPTKPGYYWAKLVRPNQMPAGEDWASLEWEIVQVNDNYGTGDETYSVAVFGVPATQWLSNLMWLAPVNASPPSPTEAE